MGERGNVEEDGVKPRRGKIMIRAVSLPCFCVPVILHGFGLQLGFLLPFETVQSLVVCGFYVLYSATWQF